MGLEGRLRGCPKEPLEDERLGAAALRCDAERLEGAMPRAGHAAAEEEEAAAALPSEPLRQADRLVACARSEARLPARPSGAPNEAGRRSSGAAAPSDDPEACSTEGRKAACDSRASGT